MNEKLRLLDPLIDPPIPRNRSERRLLSSSQIGGSLGGAVVGTGIGLLLTRNGSTADKLTGGVLGGGSIGLGIGSVIGAYRGGRKTLARRLERKEPLYTPAEEALKMRSIGAHYPLKGYSEPLPGLKVERNHSAIFQAVHNQ